MATQRPASAGRRGPIRASPPTAPSGYRISEQRRFELQGAAWFTGTQTLQAVIDLAVSEFLDRVRDEPGFTEAQANAERAVQRRAGVRRLEPGKQ